MQSTTVAAVIAAYNGASLLDRCLESVVGQTVAPDEIIVVDDGSKDNTAAVLAAWQRRDSRIRAIAQENQGCAAARNTGIAAASSEWIALLDHDDAWMPNKLETMLEERRRDPEAVVLYHDAVRPDGSRYLNDKPAVEGEILDALLDAYFILPSTMMIDRRTLMEAGLFNPARRYAEDYDCMLRLARRGRFLLVNEPLTYYEQQPTSMTRNVLAMTRGQIAVLEDLLSGKLTGPLTARQQARVRRRLALCYYHGAYGLRAVDARQSWQALARSLRLRPGAPATWKLLAGNAVHALRGRRGM